jgi:isoquinoline 1-oxidoreductase alpha subunit
MTNEFTLSVNGAKQTVTVDPDTPLLFVLRNDLKLTGPRMGCGMAQCGACAVLLNGKEIRSCITPVSGVVGQEITTLEGLPAVWAEQKNLSATEAEKTLHPVQQAWIDEQVPQCGYCQSGMMMVAVQLLAKNPNPSVEEIKDAFTNTPPSPHLCRCGTYAAIIDAVQRAGKAMRGEAV